MRFLSWIPWNTPMLSSIACGQFFPVILGRAASRGESDAAAQENGDKMLYVPKYMGWM